MRRPEQLLQQQIVRFIDAAYPTVLYYHCPNGGSRNKVEAAILKSMGVRAGVPDLCFIFPLGKCAFIELKAGKNGLTTAQKAFRDRAQQLDCLWAEVRSLNEAADVLERWLLPYGLVSKARVAA